MKLLAVHRRRGTFTDKGAVCTDHYWLKNLVCRNMSILSAPRRWKFRELIFRLQTACLAFSIFDISVVKSLLELILKCFMILLFIYITAYIYIYIYIYIF